MGVGFVIVILLLGTLIGLMARQTVNRSVETDDSDVEAGGDS